jgi:hypothetical protein
VHIAQFPYPFIPQIHPSKSHPTQGDNATWEDGCLELRGCSLGRALPTKPWRRGSQRLFWVLNLLYECKKHCLKYRSYLNGRSNWLSLGCPQSVLTRKLIPYFLHKKLWSSQNLPPLLGHSQAFLFLVQTLESKLSASCLALHHGYLSSWPSLCLMLHWGVTEIYFIFF